MGEEILEPFPCEPPGGLRGRESQNAEIQMAWACTQKPIKTEGTGGETHLKLRGHVGQDGWADSKHSLGLQQYPSSGLRK